MDTPFRRRFALLVGSIALLSLVLARPVLASRLETDVVGDTPLAESNSVVRGVSPDIDAPAGILVTGEGQVLWARSADEPRAVASTTKVMTCLLALEKLRDDEIVTLSRSTAAVGGSGVYFQVGEERTARELEIALMLESSNAAAAALAERIAGTQRDFVDMMNARASEMGLAQTAFENPHGLDAPGHHSSAADLASITRAAMRMPAFREIVALGEATIPGPNGSRRLENSNLLLGGYRGASGVKTGWTNPAGYCLIASAERDGVELIAVVLGARSADARFVDARRLMDWGFEHFGPRVLASSEETIAAVQVTDYLDRRVVALVSRDATASVFDFGGEVWREYEIAAAVDAPVFAGDQLGVLWAHQGDRLLAEIPLVAAEDVPEPGPWERLRVFVVRLWEKWFGSSSRVALPSACG